MSGYARVALRKESVDRNKIGENLTDRIRRVALRKESVDRNPYLLWQFGRAFWSLSARRAWIEIRNAETLSVLLCSSLSARRAWIEISMLCSVEKCWAYCRSPQGERG